MNVSIGDRWEGFVEDIVRSGRYNSASEVVREGLRLVEEREAKLQALRETLNGSIAAGGSNTDADLERALNIRNRVPQPKTSLADPILTGDVRSVSLTT